MTGVVQALAYADFLIPNHRVVDLSQLDDSCDRLELRTEDGAAIIQEIVYIQHFNPLAHDRQACGYAMEAEGSLSDARPMDLTDLAKLQTSPYLSVSVS
ncbi:MAG: hypothetical protein WBA57_25615 [Elainellaceae cyanobacterium]